MTDEIKTVVSNHFNLSWDYFVEPLDKKEYEQFSGNYNITDKGCITINQDVADIIESLPKEKLVILVKELIMLYNEQTDMYKMLIHQNEEMIRNGQKRFDNITSLIFKNRR